MKMRNKTKILFIIPGFSLGGTTSALISMLNCGLAYDYEIDVFAIKRQDYKVPPPCRTWHWSEWSYHSLLWGLLEVPDERENKVSICQVVKTNGKGFFKVGEMGNPKNNPED